LSAENLIKIPNGIDMEITATLMTKGITTFYLLWKTYVVKSGEKILIHAAAGGVGQIICQWAKSLGCVVIDTVGSNKKISLAKSYGCDYVINYSKENFAKKVLAITNGIGVSVVYDGVGKSTFDKSIDCLKIRGMIVSFGNTSGPVDPIIITKSIQPKGLYFTRPCGNHYTQSRAEHVEAANEVFKILKKKLISQFLKDTHCLT
jgi:NADPH2:quinone reductase